MHFKASLNRSEHFLNPLLNCNFILIVFFVGCCCVQTCYSCTFATQKTESDDTLKRLAPLRTKPFYATLYDESNKNISVFAVGVCFSPISNDTSVWFNNSDTFGLLSKATISSGKNYIRLSYEGVECSNYTDQTTWSNIMFVCDPHTEHGTMKVLEFYEKDKIRCSYTFEVGTRFACDTKEGLSSGSIFCILFFTGVGLYLLLGFLYQRLLVGAKGLEQIPNYSFWRDFGNLQADGCDFICRCGPRQEAQSYRGIDDRLPRDDERDDQLLNM